MWFFLHVQGELLVLERLWSPSMTKYYVIFSHFKFSYKRNLVQNMAQKAHLKIRPNEEPVGPWLKMENFMVGLTFDNKSDWPVFVLAHRKLIIFKELHHTWLEVVDFLNLIAQSAECHSEEPWLPEWRTFPTLPGSSQP